MYALNEIELCGLVEFNDIHPNFRLVSSLIQTSKDIFILQHKETGKFFKATRFKVVTGFDEEDYAWICDPFTGCYLKEVKLVTKVVYEFEDIES